MRLPRLPSLPSPTPSESEEAGKSDVCCHGPVASGPALSSACQRHSTNISGTNRKRPFLQKTMLSIRSRRPLGTCHSDELSLQDPLWARIDYNYFPVLTETGVRLSLLSQGGDRVLQAVHEVLSKPAPCAHICVPTSVCTRATLLMLWSALDTPAGTRVCSLPEFNCFVWEAPEAHKCSLCARRNGTLC